mmetsp:Transcript_25650/g.71751  ORF Transcript_25650/g.71751 Transcript_25650/m.71751 type:complete len:335 (-) Transcript_25650:436-1440(-)
MPKPQPRTLSFFKQPRRTSFTSSRPLFLPRQSLCRGLGSGQASWRPPQARRGSLGTGRRLSRDCVELLKSGGHPSWAASCPSIAGKGFPRVPSHTLGPSVQSAISLLSAPLDLTGHSQRIGEEHNAKIIYINRCFMYTLVIHGRSMARFSVLLQSNGERGLPIPRTIYSSPAGKPTNVWAKTHQHVGCPAGALCLLPPPPSFCKAGRPHSPSFACSCCRPSLGRKRSNPNGSSRSNGFLSLLPVAMYTAKPVRKKKMQGEKSARFQSLVRSRTRPVKVTPTIPGTAPAELVMPRSTLQCLGLRSAWLEYSPAMLKELKPSARVMQATRAAYSWS